MSEEKMSDLSPETGQALVDEMAKHPNIDQYFLRNPKEQTDADIRRLVGQSRDERALFIARDEERANKETDDD